MRMPTTWRLRYRQDLTTSEGSDMATDDEALAAVLAAVKATAGKAQRAEVASTAETLASATRQLAEAAAWLSRKDQPH